MGFVFVSRTSEPTEQEVDSRAAAARIMFGGVYFFLYPEILKLRDQTGQLIDPQKDAFFIGSDLDQLEAFILASQNLATGQSDAWEQRVGTQGGNAEPIYEKTTRKSVLQFLAELTSALKFARAHRMGVLFWGE